MLVLASWPFGITTRSSLRVTIAVERQRISLTWPVTSPTVIQSPIDMVCSSCSAMPPITSPSVCCSAKPITPVSTVEVITIDPMFAPAPWRITKKATSAATVEVTSRRMRTLAKLRSAPSNRIAEEAPIRPKLSTILPARPTTGGSFIASSPARSGIDAM
jgi:hypothetical protein